MTEKIENLMPMPEHNSAELLEVLKPFIEIWAMGGKDYDSKMKNYWTYERLHAAKTAIALQHNERPAEIDAEAVKLECVMKFTMSDNPICDTVDHLAATGRIAKIGGV